MASAETGEPAEPADFDFIIVDGFNALGSRPDGWWRDRPAAMERLVGELEALSERLGAGVAVEVCFDGRPHARVAAASVEVEVSFAGGGANAADRRIAARVRELGGRRVLVVSSDKRLAAAVKAAAGVTVGAGAFVRQQLR